MGVPRFIEPMKARLVERAPSVGNWVYEIKLDGFRALALKSGKSVQLLSRNEKELGFKFPEVKEGIAKLNAKDAIIDGEIVALEPNGKSSFQLLQAYDIGEERPPIVFYAFDLIQLNGRDFRREPLLKRKAELEKLLKSAPNVIRYSESLGDDAENLLEQARGLGLEGLIGKRVDSLYEDGRRSGAWIKLKINFEQEMVIGGYTKPQGSRMYFGSLVVGYHKPGGLYYAGRVGTGFTEAWLKKLNKMFQPLKTDTCPFMNLPEKKGDRWSPGLTLSEMRRCTWIDPKIVCQVKFTEWTRDGKLRHPVFMGLREDKEAAEVVRET